MSKYPVQYESSSKGLMDIEAMPTRYLANAAKKLLNNAHEVTLNMDSHNNYESGSALLEAMIDELASRVPPTSGARDPEST
jgi:hypothetical protein